MIELQLKELMLLFRVFQPCDQLSLTQLVNVALIDQHNCLKET